MSALNSFDHIINPQTVAQLEKNHSTNSISAEAESCSTLLSAAPTSSFQ